MNILTDALPKTVDIGNRKYVINTDFRAGIEFERSELKTEYDIYKILTLYFGDKFPEDIVSAFKAIQLFYACGKMPEKFNKVKDKGPSYCFDTDSSVIFADFWNYYSIDLSQESLHWWVFRALLLGLPQESEFKQRIYYRTCETKGLPKKERERILKIRSQIKIKDKDTETITLEERNARMRAYIFERHNEIKKGGGIIV